MFALKLILMVAVVNIASAWIAPERCQHSAGRHGVVTENISAQIITTGNIYEEILKYNEEVKSLYKDFKLYNMPAEGTYNEKTGHITINSTNNCTFGLRYNWSYRISANYGRNNNLTVRKEVDQTSYYDTFEGRKWGATVSNKSSFITIGGEASTDDEYLCYYNKYRTRHITLEDLTKDGAGITLYLYVFLTIMDCDIGTTDLEPALRNNKTYETAPENYFTKNERDELLAAASITYLVEGLKKFHMDIDKISDELFYKLMFFFPNYDFSTDTISIKENIVDVNYYQATNFQHNHIGFIPFTDSNGEAIYKYMSF